MKFLEITVEINEWSKLLFLSKPILARLRNLFESYVLKIQSLLHFGILLDQVLARHAS